MSIYLSSDLTTLEEFKRITKMKNIFRIVRSPSISGGSSGQTLIIRVINKITHRSTYQTASPPPRNKNPHLRRTYKPKAQVPLLPDAQADHRSVRVVALAQLAVLKLLKS
jgi:hypothetical protein